MPIDVTMPRLSDTMQQGTVVRWNVKEGQRVKSGDIIADIETDKATMELPTYDDGVVALLAVPEGQNVAVGTVILVLAGVNEDAGAVKARGAGGRTAGATGGSSGAAKPAGAVAAAMNASASNEHASAGVTGSLTATNGDPRDSHDSHAETRVFVSPLARKIASESGVDLHALRGTGPSGRITRKDVEAALSTPASGPAAAPAASARTLAPLPSAPAPLPARTIPLSNMRRTIARRLVESKQSIPHYQVTLEVDMDALLTLRTQLNEQLAEQGVKLSVNDFLVRACALAMRKHPHVNSRWGGVSGREVIELVSEVNIGVAIALPLHEDGTGGGLVVATLRHADEIGLRQVSAQTKALADKARSKGLALEDMSDSTFAISNLGMFGVAHFTAIINPPNTAILAVGAALEKPVVRQGPNGAQVVPGHVMSMTMSSDHRVIDGAMAAQYLSTVKSYLEKPATLLV